MGTAVLFIGWNRPFAGRESDAFRYLMTEGRAALEKFQAEGFFESLEQVGLTPHGGGLGGFVLLTGDRAKLDELRRTDAFERFSMNLNRVFDGYGVVPGVNRAGMDAVTARNPDIFKA